MMQALRPIQARNVEETSKKSLYPAPFNKMMMGRSKRKLGDIFGLQNFGVNHTTLAPKAISALKHYHAKQDEFIYIVSGQVTLHYGDESLVMNQGDCFGFKAGVSLGHQVENTSLKPAVYLEIGDRSPKDIVEYPEDDLKAVSDEKGNWEFTHKDGSPY